MDKVTIAIVFTLYMLVMIGIGVYFYFKKKNDSDAYLLAGRNLNPWVASMSAQASDMSGWLLTGLPGLACSITLASVGAAKEAIWTAIGLLIGTILNWILVGKRLRVYTEILGDSQTLPEYFQNRFEDKKGILRAVSSLIILVFFTVYTASMFSASAKLFNSVFGLSYLGALFLGATIIVCYVFLGGFLAISYTDLIQGLLMFFTLIIIPFVLMGALTPEQNGLLGNLLGQIGNLLPNANNDISAITIISCLGWGLGYCGMPHILVRFMATKDKRVFKPATIISSVWAIITLTAAIFIGIMGAVYVPELQDKENVFMAVVGKLFHPILAGIMLSAVLAAIMSTADSQLLVASTAFANDFYKVAIRKNASNKEIVWINRFTIIIVSIIAIVIALDPKSSIFTLVSYAWAGFGASFGPLVFFSLYSNKITLKGAVASISTGAITTIILFTLKSTCIITSGFWMIYEIIPGFVFASIVLWIVSLIDKKGAEPLKEGFDNMIKELKSKDADVSKDSIIKEETLLENDAENKKLEIAESNSNKVVLVEEKVEESTDVNKLSCNSIIQENLDENESSKSE